MPTIWRGFSSMQGNAPSWLVRYDDVAKWMDIPEVAKELQERQTESGFVMNWNGPEALSRNDVVGFHCVLIRRDVLEAIGEPFCVGNELGVREDFDWSERVIKAGFDLFVDKSVIIGHTIAHSIRPLDYYIYALAREADNKPAP
jgi:GT2 family glycosyltransferase